MKTPRFSVIIPTLNEEKFLPRLLDSLTKQTYKNFEVIIADGISVDKTVSKAKMFQSHLALRIMQGKKVTVSSQRNRGAYVSKGEWLIFADADIVFLPKCLDDLDRFIKKTDPKIFTTWITFEKKDIFHMVIQWIGNGIIEGLRAIGRPWAPGPFTVVRKDIFDAIGGYEEGVTYAEDHDFSMNAKKKGFPLKILREPLYCYSLRRYETNGYLKTSLQYLYGTMWMIFRSKGPKHLQGFVAGGGQYKDT